MADGHVSIIRVNNNYDPYFICFYLRSHLGQIQIEKKFSGSSGQIELQTKEINSLILPASESLPKKQQEEISKIIRTKIEEALVLEKEAADKLSEANKLFEKLIKK